MAMEILILIIFLMITAIFLIRWYMFSLSSKNITPQSKGIKPITIILPIICAAIIITTLCRYASYDVTDSPLYIFMYTVIGMGWLYISLVLISALFDLSWIDDVLNLKNKAALFSILGLSIAVSLIYSGANIGDGPGWWCVFIAGGIGLILLALMLFILNITTKMSYRLTVKRDIGFSIRLLFFFVAAGILLGRASGGDWFSFSRTVIDFRSAWVLLPILLVFILIERLYIVLDKNSEKINENHIFSSFLVGAIFVAAAVLSIVFLLKPYAENPAYYFSLPLWVSL